MIDFYLYNPIIPADYKAKGRDFTEASPLRCSFLFWWTFA